MSLNRVSTTVASFFLKAFNLTSGLITSIVLTRILSIEDFGIYTYIISSIFLMVVLVQFGFPVYSLRETSRGMALKKYTEVTILWNCLHVSAWTLSVLVVLTSYLIYIFYGIGINYIYAVILIPLIVIERIKSATLRGLSHIIYGQLGENLLRPTIFIILIVCFSILSTQAVDYVDVINMYIYSALAVLIIVTAIYKKSTKSVMKKVGSIGIFASWQKSKSLMIYSRTKNFAFIAILAQFNLAIGVIALSLYSSPGEVSLFKISQQVAMTVVFGLMVANVVYAPYFAKFKELNDYANLKKYLKINIKISFGSALLITTILVLFGDLLLVLLFGEVFSDSYGPMLVIALGQLVSAAIGPVGLLLNMGGHEKQVFTGLMVSSIVNLLLCYILIGEYNAMGAAFASMITTVFWNLYLWRKVKLIMGINSFMLNVKNA